MITTVARAPPEPTDLWSRAGLPPRYRAPDVRPPSGSSWDDVHVTMPTESLVRLVYRRLDPEHTQGQVEGDDEVLDRLRATFPGF